ncbi:dTDP-4-dehydrorhamnose reductase [Aestuariirhabdus litorea]|uniref:dTDP-4-dehydrorhamnose reductase n=1 Tax=Aestuariirhabdus litorea TaxID=2528527 RepID=A0A3P3VI03_9GAMM|nr:dTDP-4-dehydrorhamnose reductase [Aestuariirhabdus litorea]RRJ82350.1 dTDP-4-dehydrorhamnose reductase [Aestuariirhabdus litorea]RWW92515.1 dTDP-4-dehydrorhamnose reductase [Endozoicomonadaceae bacterium GTF-13]
MKILITGANGQLGRCLQERLCLEPGLQTVACDRAQLDISCDPELGHYLEQERPALVINAAAYTAVDRAEEEQALAYRVNALGPELLARHCARLQIPLTQISTDFVFDGRHSLPYQESDPCHPLSIYGQSKWAGEERVREHCPRHLIVRTSWVFSSHGANFVKTMLRLMAEREHLGIVDDQVGCPTSAADLAEAVLSLSRQAMNNPALFGTYHFCNQGATSWYRFAEAIYQQATELGLLASPCNLSPITTDQYPTAAVRPAYSVLDTAKLSAAINHSPRPWQDALRATLTTLKESDHG